MKGTINMPTENGSQQKAAATAKEGNKNYFKQ